MSTGRRRRPSSRGRVRTLTVVAVTGAAVLLSAGGAAAFWRANGSGTGSAKAGNQGSITFTTTATAAAGFLYPGGPAIGMAIAVNRNSTVAFTVQTMALDTSRNIVADGITTPTDCISSATQSRIVVTPKTGIGQSVPSGSGTVVFTLSSAVAMSSSAPVACQGAIFDIPIVMTGTVP